MWIKALLVAALAGVLAFGATLVARSKQPVTYEEPAPELSTDTSSVSTISRGEEVDLRAHVGPDGTFTIFEFYADW